MKNIVFIVNIKDEHKKSRAEPYRYSIDSWQRWCEKNDCELIVLDQRAYPVEVMNANWHKILVFELLEGSNIEYNQILIVDADTIIHPDAPNIFDLTQNKFCAVRNHGSMDWVCRSYENYKKHLFPSIEYSPTEYFNSGVLVVNKTHRGVYEKLHKYYIENYRTIQHLQQTYGVGTDQPVLNFFLRQEKIDINLLSYEWNMQDMTRFEVLNNDMLFLKCGWLYHFCAIPGGDDTTYFWMQKTYEQLFK